MPMPAEIDPLLLIHKGPYSVFTCSLTQGLSKSVSQLAVVHLDP